MEQNLSLYKIFYAVANTHNISHAAKELYISQPAISKAIGRLEQNLGVTLFTRNSRGVQLTDEGRLLYDYVSTAFCALSQGEDQLKLVNELGIGHLRIGVSTTLCKYVLLPYLKSFVEQYPHIKISIKCQSTNLTLELLEQNKIDIGLIGRPAQQRNLNFDSLGKIQDIFVATSSYLANLSLRNHGQNNEIQQTATWMLLDKENMSRQYIDGWLKESLLDLSHILEISSLDLLIEFAKISLGIACVIQEFVLKELSEGLLIQVPLGSPVRKREIGFAYKPHDRQSHSLKSFMEFYHNLRFPFL